MKRTILLMAAVGLMSVTSAVPAPEQKVTICHIPPGNPDNAHTITVGASAVPAHLAHGDVLDACEAPAPPPPDGGGVIG